MTAISDLLERIEKATGADEMLDSELEWTLGEWTNLGGWWRQHKVTGEREMYSYRSLPSYTASIDAALALVERKLPKDFHFIELSIQQRTHCEIHDQRVFDALATSDAPTAPLAILAALLKALETP